MVPYLIGGEMTGVSLASSLCLRSVHLGGDG